MKKTPLVSILVPLYNSEKYIAETIENCLNQSYENIEIIIVNDGSTDNSLQIAREYEEKHDKIKVFTQENLGAPAARNKAFERSSGDYIQYLDADDLLHKDKISSQMQRIEKENDNDATFVFGRYTEFYPNDNIENLELYDFSFNKDYEDYKVFLIDFLISQKSLVCMTWLIPRNIMEVAGPWREDLTKNQDSDFLARIVSKSEKFIYVKDSISYYRRGLNNSISMRRDKEAYSSYLKSCNSYYKVLESHLDVKHARDALRLLYSRYICYTYPKHFELREMAERQIKLLGFKNPIVPNRSSLKIKLVSFFGFHNYCIIREMSRSIKITIKSIVKSLKLKLG